MTHGSEAWLMTVQEKQRLERAERTMVGHMYGVTMNDRDGI